MYPFYIRDKYFTLTKNTKVEVSDTVEIKIKENICLILEVEKVEIITDSQLIRVVVKVDKGGIRQLLEGYYDISIHKVLIDGVESQDWILA